jgi:hypothetical protein
VAGSSLAHTLASKPRQDGGQLPLTGKKKDTKAPHAGVKRWSSVASATVVVLIMATPPLLFLLGGRLGAPVVWIRSTVASVGASQTGNYVLLSSGAWCSV